MGSSLDLCFFRRARRTGFSNRQTGLAKGNVCLRGFFIDSVSLHQKSIHEGKEMMYSNRHMKMKTEHRQTLGAPAGESTIARTRLREKTYARR
jgi:hypothetical protein